MMIEQITKMIRDVNEQHHKANLEYERYAKQLEKSQKEINLKERLVELAKERKIKFSHCYDAGETYAGDFYMTINGIRSRVQLEFNDLSDEQLLRFVINPMLTKKEGGMKGIEIAQRLADEAMILNSMGYFQMASEKLNKALDAIIEKEKLMTRNEAIAKWSKCEKDEYWIDFFIETGMLKVEEEKDTVKAKLSNGGYNTDTLILELDKLGLKIVEK